MAIFRYNFCIFILLTIIISCSPENSGEQLIQADSVENKNDNIVISDDSIEKFVKIDIPVDDIIPAEFSDEDVKRVKQSGQAPFVINLRKGFNDFFNRKSNSKFIEKSAMTAIGDNMNTYDIQYFKSKFHILTINDDYKGGGVFLDILFKDKPDKVFTVWMFETDNVYKIRMFQQNLDYSASEIKATLKLFENIFKMKGTAF